jgi:death on curing protein
VTPASFLTFDEVLAIHGHLIARYGGSPGIRDVGLLRSALAVPEATYDGVLLHPTIHEQAAAYCFHLVKNHPFVDGNKRAGLAVALAFLRLNGSVVRATNDELVDLILGIIAGRYSKADAAVFLSDHAC